MNLQAHKKINSQKVNPLNFVRTNPLPLQLTPDLKRLELMSAASQEEVISFLNIRPKFTFAMTSFILDNGIESANNRGSFYGFRSVDGKLEGVALIGHTTLIEAHSDEAIMALAVVARQSETPVKMIMADLSTIERFWQNYKAEGQEPRLVCTELFFEINFPFAVPALKWHIREAKPSELALVAEAHAQVALMESGVNPLEKDPEGFLKRCLKRIEKGRTFVVIENGKLIFKADIAAETGEVIYLEGLFVNEEMRGNGVGTNCLASLSIKLLERTNNICMLSNVECKGAHRSYEKAGFKNTSWCQTIFV